MLSGGLAVVSHVTAVCCHLVAQLGLDGPRGPPFMSGDCCLDLSLSHSLCLCVFLSQSPHQVSYARKLALASHMVVSGSQDQTAEAANL